jgi:NOL1/NOP2/sun family putative RNA methylase
MQQLNMHGVTCKPTPLKNCFEYEAAFSISTTTEHLTGKFYMQGLASQAVTHVLAPKKDWLVIDMAAAPGSKTTHIAQEMHNTGRVLALDKNSERLLALRSNTERLGITNVISVRKDARFAYDLNIVADAVLLDAPCSGNYCSEENWEDKRMLSDVQKNARVQKELVKAAHKLLKPGGVLVYSTCSLEPEENELILQHAIDMGFVVEPTGLPDLGQSPGLTEFDGKELDASIAQAARFWPYKTGTEGFFVAKLRKSA